MKQWFQELLLRRNVNQLKNAPINVATHPLNQVKNIIVLFDATLPVDPLLLRQKIVAIADKNAKITFLNYNKKKMAHQNAFIAVSPLDLSFGGQLRPWLQDICSAQYDVVIHFFNTPKTVMEWIGLHLKAPLRVGFKNVPLELNNLILDFPQESLDGFFESLTKYMNIINQSSK